MGFLKLNYDDVNTGDFKPLSIGDYECIVSSVEVTKASTGNDMIKVMLTVRDDVEQEGRKRKFFDNLVATDNMMWKFSQVGKAAGVGQEIEELADFANDIQYKNVIIRNKHRLYNGETQDSVGTWKESALASPEFTGQMNENSVDVDDDDDLPF